jgi:hypothetical protein
MWAVPIFIVSGYIRLRPRLTKFWFLSVDGAEGRSFDEWCVVTVVTEFCQQLADFHLDQFNHLLVSYVALVDENLMKKVHELKRI